MQPLDNDMDELFKRAGEEYPLNTNGSDWEKVYQQLQADEGDLSDSEKGKRDYRFLWLLLLLPLGFVCGRYTGSSKFSAGEAANKTTGAASLGIKKAEVTAAAKMNNHVGDDSNTGKTVVEKSSVPEAPASKTNTTAEGIRGSITKPASSPQVDKVAANTSGKTVRSKGKRLISRSRWSKDFAGNSGGNSARNSNTDVSKRSKKGVNQNAVDTPSLTFEKTPANPGTATPNTGTNAAIDTSATRTTVVNQATKAITDTEHRNVKQKDSKRRFSYSLLVGPDVSTVKLQKTSKVGYTLGLMFNYRLSKRITLETGALWDRKNYYTEGKYMDTAPLKLPMHSVVNSAAGYCNMFEIPVNVKFDFSPGKTNSWFVSAGLSSYLMKNENYDVSYTKYGQQYMKDYGYLNATKDWFSVVNLSMGYQKSVGKHTTIGIAPYIKLPLKGIGIGKLPVSSSGIYFTLGRSLK